MLRPLYKNLSQARIPLGSGNAGLWYDKFCDSWRYDWSLSGDGQRKLGWIETVTKERLGSEPSLEESTLRLLRLSVARHGRFGIFETDSRFVTGLGRSHPVENGFAWHHSLGLPYLPGSSIKGLVRDWAERDSGASTQRVEEVLGSPVRGAGRVCFLDAIPIEPVRLEADVVTPHYAGWAPNEPPGDWCGPVPIPFLTTASQTAFAFAILPMRSNDPSCVDEAFMWLRSALQDAGAGAKTAVGYGRFKFDERKTKLWLQKPDELRRAQSDAVRRALAQQTPQGRWSLVFEGKSEGELLDLVRIRLEKEPIVEPSERMGFARAMSETGMPAFWRRGLKQDKRTQVGSSKLRERAKLVDANLHQEEP